MIENGKFKSMEPISKYLDKLPKTHIKMSSNSNTSIKFPEIWDSQEYVV
jgi:hypothetical protein